MTGRALRGKRNPANPSIPIPGRYFNNYSIISKSFPRVNYKVLVLVGYRKTEGAIQLKVEEGK